MHADGTNALTVTPTKVQLRDQQPCQGVLTTEPWWPQKVTQLTMNCQERNFNVQSFQVHLLVDVDWTCSKARPWRHGGKQEGVPETSISTELITCLMPCLVLTFCGSDPYCMSTCPEVCLYVAGFPCTPYSLLGLLKRFEDPNSQPLFGIIRHLKKTQPAVSGLNQQFANCVRC